MRKIQSLGRPKTYTKTSFFIQLSEGQRSVFVAKVLCCLDITASFLDPNFFKMGIEKNIPKDQEEGRQIVQENQR